MASNRRILGAGRVLGSARSASPAIPSSAQPAPGDNTGVLSPSESTSSLPSLASSAPRIPSADDNDITSAAARRANEAVAAASASTRLFCPICNEEMVTLLQLNRHLDTEHQDLENTEQDEVKTWFKSQMVKAKKFHPLAVLNQRFLGLDVFESNEDHRLASASASRTQAPGAPSTPEPVRQDPDELVTKEHWQRYTRDGLCSDPLCGQRLGTVNGNVNCRKCGKLFCEVHTMYQMKLSRSALWEPVRGYWCRVCETCYKSRDGYNDHNGLERDHTAEFSTWRRKAVDKSYLEISRLEKRLTKLTQLLAENATQQEQGVVGYLRSFSGAPSQRRQIEQTIVEWEDDSSVSNCPFCRQEFSTYTFKRHHCRLCGRVVCADPRTSCSAEIGLNVATNNPSEKGGSEVPVDVRMCQDCRRTVFSKADFANEIAKVPPDQRSYVNLKEFERGIRVLLPRFQKLLATLQDPDQPPSPAQLSEATKVRKRLTDSFTQYSVAARRIRDLPTSSNTQAKLQQQVFAQASNFLHVHMLPLKSLPKILKHTPASHHHRQAGSTDSNGHLRPVLSSSSTPKHSPSQSIDSSSALSSLEDEEKELRERLIVLEEQKFMVGEMLAQAVRRRKFEEVESLGRNVEDLTKECDTVQKQLENVRREFEGLYVGEGTS